MALGIEVEVFKEQAMNELAEIERALNAAEEGNAPVKLDQSSVGRLSRMDAMQQQAMSAGMTERLKLQRRRLLAALDRIRAGQYGVCCICHGDLPVERLQADLGAPFCIDCQEEIDEKRKVG